MGVGGIFLYEQIRIEIALPLAVNGFHSIPRFWGEIFDFLLKKWCFGVFGWHSTCVQNPEILMTRNFPAQAEPDRGLSLYEKGACEGGMGI